MDAASPIETEAEATSPALSVVLFVTFLNQAGYSLLIPLLPFFAQSLHAVPWQVAALFSAYSIGQFFAEPFWGRLSDRIGRRPILLATLGLGALSYVALAFVPNIWMAFGVRLVAGVAGGCLSTLQGYIADVSPKAKRAGRMGVLGSFGSFGVMVGPGLGGLLADPAAGALGFQRPLFASAILSALAALAVVFALRESRTHVHLSAAPQVGRREALRLALAHPVASKVLFITVLATLAFAGSQSVLGLWAAERLHWGPRDVSFSYVLAGTVSAIIQGLVTGPLARRFGEPYCIAFGLSLATVAFIVWPFALIGYLMLMTFAVNAFCQSLIAPNCYALIAHSSTPDRYGVMLGVNQAGAAFARGIGPLIAGAAFGFSPDLPFYVAIVLILPAIWLSLSAGRAFVAQRETKISAPAA